MRTVCLIQNGFRKKETSKNFKYGKFCINILPLKKLSFIFSYPNPPSCLVTSTGWPMTPMRTMHQGFNNFQNP